jgi:anaerobic magnesium-protoporphyrin IX monomethyl ester cyclase
MRVMFVSVNQLKSYRPVLPIGMVTVATQVKTAGHDVRCVDLMFEEDEDQVIRRETTAFKPDVIGISIRNVDSLNLLEPAIYTPLAREVAECARAVRPEVKIVLGGAGFTTVPEDLMEFIGADYGIVGFAEETMTALLCAIEQGIEPSGIPGIIYYDRGHYHRKPPSFALDYRRVIPPDRSFYDPRYFEYAFETHDDIERVPATVQTKKGCVLECVFCSNFLIDGTGVTSRDPISVADEVERIAADGMDRFEIVDGVFNLPLHNALGILQEFEKRGLRMRWSCMINPGAVNSELVELMAKTGCREVEFGTDSCNNRVLGILKKNFRKRQVYEVHRMFRDAGIRTMHCLFIGSPGDDGDSVRETFDVMDELVPADGSDSHVYWTFGLRICRGTELFNIAVREGLIQGNECFLVPKYYVSPQVRNNGELLEEIRQRVLRNKNWYLWWGLSSISLQERLEMSMRDNQAIEQLVLERIRNRPQQLVTLSRSA